MYNKFDFKGGLYKGGNFMENKTKAKIVMGVGIVAIISVIVVLIVAIANPCKVNETKENYTFYNTGNVAEEGRGESGADGERQANPYWYREANERRTRHFPRDRPFYWFSR